MINSRNPKESAMPTEISAEITAELNRCIEQAAALLPAQGPITAFVFLNTLQALEHLPFDEAVQKGAQLFNCQPYLAEDVYREKLNQDRILLEDLSVALRRNLKDQADTIIASRVTRHQLQLAMLQYPLRDGPTEELQWFIAETDALRKLRPDASSTVRKHILVETKHWVMRDLRTQLNHHDHQPQTQQIHNSQPFPVLELIDRFGASSIERWSDSTWEEFTLQALWRVCRNGMVQLPTGNELVVPPLRNRDLLLKAHDVDIDQIVHPVLIRFCASFVDQGFANWPLPHREDGFYRSFLKIYQSRRRAPGAWPKRLAEEVDRLTQAEISPIASIVESLDSLNVPCSEWSDYIIATLLALRGWAGMIWQLEARPDRQAVSVKPGTLLEFLAVRLILERLALTHVAQTELQINEPLHNLRQILTARLPNVEHQTFQQRAFRIFQLAQVLGLSPAVLSRLTESHWQELNDEIESFTSMERRRVFHQAYERYFKVQTLDALAVHSARSSKQTSIPRFQTVHCIDTREESFRRHLEEIVPDCETFGAAGFFSVPMYFKGVSDAHFTALSPIVIKPRHWVTEEVDESASEAHQRTVKTRRFIGLASHNAHLGSRSLTIGALLATAFGALATIPLVARVLFPRLTARIQQSASRFVETPLITRLRLERRSATPGPSKDEIGFSLDEMTQMTERLLRDIGLTAGFARLVAFFGHGSFCLNNPHKSCYDCGACSGNSGAPNARAMAAMLNDPRVRSALFERGIRIPADTHFLGGSHNTCNDSILFDDLDQLPVSHREDFGVMQASLEEACERNAHERCRRFQSAPLDLSFAAARRHVEARSEDLAQPRPEFGNASNAICFVGRRSRIRGLYLDRRCFLHSYDPDTDGLECRILDRILSAVVPVCAGISLQYFFSSIDSPGWGSGTKLPHNITSLLGVMDGAASDLRSGLPWQGVEIHEPLRLLMVVECTPEGMRQIIARSDAVRNLVLNGWIQLALLDPDSHRILVYRDQDFHLYEPTVDSLPKAESSVDWYRGWRDHLGFAQIQT